MEIKDLQARQGKVDITLDIVDVGDVREFEKFGKTGRVANAIGKDASGDIKITLWNDDIGKVKAGDKVKIENGYVSEWQGELQLGTGKFGKMEVIGESSETKEEATSPPDSEANKETLQEAEQEVKQAEETVDVEEEDISE
ncbi:hypothetical protein ISS07_01920 [Candidatus Woesearchaeota archaeon]|nr:hypothetical protein [Candidatus Woesearchaeota archaeon]